jgi:hypothetical protein
MVRIAMVAIRSDSMPRRVIQAVVMAIAVTPQVAIPMGMMIMGIMIMGMMLMAVIAAHEI